MSFWSDSDVSLRIQSALYTDSKHFVCEASDLQTTFGPQHVVPVVSPCPSQLPCCCCCRDKPLRVPAQQAIEDFDQLSLSAGPHEERVLLDYCDRNLLLPGR